MVLHVPDIDNPGERDAVETLLAMRNSSRINHRDNASNSSEDDHLYSPYLRASPVRGPRVYRGDEASSSYSDYPKMRRPSKLARVGKKAAIFIYIKYQFTEDPHLFIKIVSATYMRRTKLLFFIFFICISLNLPIVINHEISMNLLSAYLALT